MTITTPDTVPAYCKLWGIVGPQDYTTRPVPTAHEATEAPARPTTEQIVRRLDKLVARVRLGTMRPAVAQRTVELWAPVLPVEVYDLAIDAIADHAGDETPLAPNSFDDLAVRWARGQDTVDARTRRERRRAARLISRGDHGVGHAINVRASDGAVRTTAGRHTVECYRPVWAAGSTVTATAQRVPSEPALCTVGGVVLPAVTLAERRRGVTMRSRLLTARVDDAVVARHADDQLTADMRSGDAWT